MSEKNFHFLETTRSFKYEWLLLFPWIYYSTSEGAYCCFSCVLFGHDFPTKASQVKNLFSQPFRAWPSAVSYFRAHCESKKKKLILHMNLFKAFTVQHGLNLWTSYEINLLCGRKYKHEVEENREILTPVSETIVTLGMLGLPFRELFKGSAHENLFCQDKNNTCR